MLQRGSGPRCTQHLAQEAPRPFFDTGPRPPHRRPEAMQPASGMLRASLGSMTALAAPRTAPGRGPARRGSGVDGVGRDAAMGKSVFAAGGLAPLAAAAAAVATVARTVHGCGVRRRAASRKRRAGAVALALDALELVEAEEVRTPRGRPGGRRLRRASPARRAGAPARRPRQRTRGSGRSALAAAPAEARVNWDAVAPEEAEAAWRRLSDAPCHARLGLVHHLAARGRLRAVGAREAVAVCGGAALEVLSREGGVARLPEVEAQVARVLRDLPEQCGPGPHDVSELAPAACLALVHVGGGQLGAWALPLLESLVDDIQEEPAAYGEVHVLAVAEALALAGAKGPSKTWGLLAGALVARWSTVGLQELCEAMLSLPPALAAGPRALRTALAELCEEDNSVLLPLGQNGLAHIIDAWGEHGCKLPASLRSLLHRTVEHHLMALDARRLAGASALLEDGSPYVELAVAEWWRVWLERLLEYRRLSGWGRCSEALREARLWRDRLWRDSAEYPWLASGVLRGVVARLAEVADEAPLQLGLELGRAAEPGGEAASLLEVKLEEQVRRRLRGEEGGLPLMLAVAVANGETPVRCGPGAKLWKALTKMSE